MRNRPSIATAWIGIAGLAFMLAVMASPPATGIELAQLPDDPYCCTGVFQPNPPSGANFCALACDSPGRGCTNKIKDADGRYSIDYYGESAGASTRAKGLCAEENIIFIE